MNQHRPLTWAPLAVLLLSLAPALCGQAREPLFLHFTGLETLKPDLSPDAEKVQIDVLRAQDHVWNILFVGENLGDRSCSQYVDHTHKKRKWAVCRLGGYETLTIKEGAENK